MELARPRFARSGFPCWSCGRERSDAILGARGALSTDGRQQFIPPLTPITIMRQLGANIRMKENGDVLEIEDDQGTTHTEKLVRERSGHVHSQLDFFSREGWKLPDSFRAQLKFDPLMASNRHEKFSYGSTNSRTRNKRSLCRRLSVTVWMPWKPSKPALLRPLGTMSFRKTCGRISVP